ncbi:hypothetical protein V8C34DRAFT_301955 [Trichoderma compactum]
MSYPGAAPPPEGVIPDLAHPQDVLRTVNYVTQGLTIFFVSIIVAVRFCAKARVPGGGFTPDDCAYARILYHCMFCRCTWWRPKYMGSVKEEVEKYFQVTIITSFSILCGKLTSSSKSCYAATIFYAPIAMTVKLALLVIIIRVFGSVHRRTLIGIYIFIGMIVAYYVSGFFTKIFICDASKCMNQSAIVTADSIISIISDLAILLLPTPLTWSLQLPRRKRLRVKANAAESHHSNRSEETL